MLLRKLKQAFSRLRTHHIPFLVIGLIALLLSVGLVVTLLQKEAPATSGNIYLAKAETAVQKGSEARFDVRITPGTRIDTVTATARYDTSKLTFKSAAYSNSPFTSQIPATAQSGMVTVQAAKLGGQTVEDDAFVATLVFTALMSGDARLELTDGNAARAGSPTNPTVNHKTIDRSSAPNASGVGSATQSGTTNDSAGHSDNGFIGIVTKPLTALLAATGITPRAAETGALWLSGLLLCLLVTAALIIVRIVRRKKSNKEIRDHDYDHTTIS